MRTHSHPLVVAVSVLAIAGCSAAAGDSGPHRELSSEAIKAMGRDYAGAGMELAAELLADGEVTADDYQQMVDAERQCFEELGYTLTEPQLSPADGLLLIYEVLPGNKSHEAQGRDWRTCEGLGKPQVEGIYATREQRIDEPLRVAAIKCLSEQGITVEAGAKNLEELSGDPTQDGGAQREAAARCIGELALELYPELPHIGQGY